MNSTSPTTSKEISRQRRIVEKGMAESDTLCIVVLYVCFFGEWRSYHRMQLYTGEDITFACSWMDWRGFGAENDMAS